MRKLQSLEMLRGVAALLVVLFHTPIILAIPLAALPLSRIARSGYRGVDLFFVLSGFIIAHVHGADIGRTSRLANYAFNRVARLFPAVCVMTFVASVLSALGWGIVDAAIKPGIWNTVASVLLLPEHGDAILNVTWSLKYELMFYLCFAGLILDLRFGVVLLGVWQFELLRTLLTSRFDAGNLDDFYLRPICLEFTTGLVCAWFVARPWFATRMKAAPAQWSLLAAGAGTFVYGMAARGHTHMADLCCALSAGLIIVALVLLERCGRFRVPQALVRLGGASYSIYLVHYSAIALLAHAFIIARSGPIPTEMLLPSVAFGTLAGFVFDRTLDRPIQRFLRDKLKPALLRADSTRPAMHLGQASH